MAGPLPIAAGVELQGLPHVGHNNVHGAGIDDEERATLLSAGSPTSSSARNNAGSGSSLSSYLVNISAVTHRNRKHVHSFYEHQNSIIESLIETEALHRDPSMESPADAEAAQAANDAAANEAAAEEAQTQRALNLSFASNFVLLVVRVGVALVSGSLSLLVTSLDAVLDVISGGIIWGTSRSSKKRDKYKYPIGKARMAPLGVVVFSTIMGTAGMSIIAEGAKQLVEGEPKEDDWAPTWVIIASSVFVVVMKGGMWFMCRNSKNAAVQAFALDHLNDVVVNSAGLAGAMAGRYLLWWLDPAAAIVMSLWLIWAWGKQAYEQLTGLVGLSAPPHVLQKLTYVAFNHAPDVIQQIDTVRAYSFGAEDSWLVELDIVLPADMPLRDAHDVGEALQLKLERLPEVARAYVHLDYESSHAPDYEHKVF
uniref:Cation efflux protein transmembrane domain-containing protein n=1 Tax=Chlamydomonas leiostraca TaxID=1034604 RepID=A0A7S0RH28_9CHLO